jgi:L,D-transpeptidase catalytic domain
LDAAAERFKSSTVHGVKIGRVILLLGLLAGGCARDNRHVLLISTADQRMFLLRDSIKIAEYPVSTSKFGVGDALNSNATPLGLLKVRKKIGKGAPAGAVFKSRRRTGEILPIDAPGRDPIVTRILWLEGREPQNRHAFRRYIYIHGTPEERTIGLASSYGCVRMRSADVISLYDTVAVGARVLITTMPFKRPEQVH